MKFSVTRAGAGLHLRLDPSEWPLPLHDRLAVVICERGSRVTVPTGMPIVCAPLAGHADLAAAGCNVPLVRGDVYVGDAQTPHDIAVAERGAALVIAGNVPAWAAVGDDAPAGARSAAVLFPALHRGRRALTRRLLRFARLCAECGDSQSGHLAQRLAGVIESAQSEFAAMIARCPGASLTRKRAVFLRLQRVRNHIAACAHLDLDVASLAVMANYSVGHFITTFRSVFAETPYSSVSRYRLESASGMLSAGELGIGDIAQSIGFQSRSSFNRAIKRRLGLSASQYRESLREATAR